MLVRAQASYRVVIDILSKMDLAGLYLIQFDQAMAFVKAYASDHIKFLPQLEATHKTHADDKLLTRTILQALTQICGPISFSLLARICHCLLVAKIFVKAQADREDDDGHHGAEKAHPSKQAAGSGGATRNEVNDKLGKPLHLTTMVEASRENSMEQQKLKESLERGLHKQGQLSPDNRRASQDQAAGGALGGGKTQELPLTPDLLQQVEQAA